MSYRIACMICILLLILTSMVNIGTIPISSSGNLELVSIDFRSSTSGLEVYPGSKNALLIVELRNKSNYTLRGLEGCLTVPDGIHSSTEGSLCSNPVSTNNTPLWNIPPNTLFQLRYLLDIDKELSPGTYGILLNITYTINNSTIEEYFSFNITISRYPEIKLDLIDHYWEPEDVYPGTSSATLQVLLKNTGNSSISRIYLKLCLLEGFEPNIIRREVYGISVGDIASISFSGIDILPSTTPGYYTLTLEGNVTAVTDDGVEYEGFWSIDFNVLVSEPVVPLVSIIDTGFINKVVYNSSRFGDVYVTIQNNDLRTIKSIVAKLYLPKGVRTIDNRSYAIGFYEGVLGFGEITTISFEDINISTSCLSINFTLDFLFTVSYRGAEYQVNHTINFTLDLMAPERYLVVVGTRIIYNGEPAAILPSSRGVVFEIVLLNIGPSTIKTITPSITLPSGIEVSDIALSSYQGVGVGSTTVVRLELNVDDNVSPGEYSGLLKYLLLVQSGDTLSYVWEECSFTIPVSDPSYYKPRLEVVNAYWGRGEPQTVYPGQRMVSLYVELYNYGRYSAGDVVATLCPLNSTVGVIEEESVVGSIGSGGFSTAVFILDLRDVVNGTLHFKLSIRYVVKLYGSFLEYSLDKTVFVELGQFEGYRGRGLEIASYGWSTEPVFPSTENASYTIRVVNRNPFTIQGVNAKLYLPSGFHAKEGVGYVETYVPGPIPSMQTTDLSFTITVGDVKPGVYACHLILDYILQTGGYSKRVFEEYTIAIQVHDPGRAIVFIDSYWLHKSVSGREYGQYLVIVLQNILYPSITGVSAEIELPNGIVFTHTNMSKAIVYPSKPSISPEALASIPGFKELGELAKYIQYQYTSPSKVYEFGKGDYIVFTIPIHIVGSIDTGFYNVYVNLRFIDHHGCYRSQAVDARIGVLGGLKYVEVLVPESVYVKELSKTVNLTIKLYGSGVVHDVFLTVYPCIPVVTPYKSVYYLGDLFAPNTYSLNIKLLYNPLYLATTPIPVRYGSIPIVFTLIYTDELGYRHVVNTSSTIVLIPYIKLSIRDLKAVERDGVLRVSGTIVNTGSSIAERVKALFIVDNNVLSTFIGDIDPGSEASFSIEGLVNISVDKGLLVITYYDAYDQEHNYTVYLGIVHEKAGEEVIQPREGLGFLEYTTIVSIVTVFLIVAGLMIYRTLKKHAERLSATE